MSSVYIRSRFLLNTCTFARLIQIINSILNKYNLIYPTLADEIVEPHPDMNIEVAAFTVTQKLYNSCNISFENRQLLYMHEDWMGTHAQMSFNLFTICVGMHKVYKKPDKISAHACSKEWFDY